MNHEFDSQSWFESFCFNFIHCDRRIVSVRGAIISETNLSVFASNFHLLIFVLEIGKKSACGGKQTPQTLLNISLHK